MNSLLAVLFNGFLFFSTTSSVHTSTVNTAETNTVPVTNNMLLNFVDLCNLSCTDCVVHIEVSIQVNAQNQIEIVAVNGNSNTVLDAEIQSQIRNWMTGSNTCFEADTTYSIYVNLVLDAPVQG